MIHSVFVFLKALGYDHPIHPMVTHITVGLTIGTIVFGLISVIFRRVRLKLTAWHCAMLAIVSIVPTVLFGYMDWREKFNGEWLTPIIIKMILAGALFVCLFAALMLGRVRDWDRHGTEATDTSPWREPKAIAALILYAVCTGIVVVIGYLGGSLVY
jgi:uncharacterized membrane protein